MDNLFNCTQNPSEPYSDKEIALRRASERLPCNNVSWVSKWESTENRHFHSWEPYTKKKTILRHLLILACIDEFLCWASLVEGAGEVFLSLSLSLSAPILPCSLPRVSTQNAPIANYVRNRSQPGFGGVGYIWSSSMSLIDSSHLSLTNRTIGRTRSGLSGPLRLRVQLRSRTRWSTTTSCLRMLGEERKTLKRKQGMSCRNDIQK